MEYTIHDCGILVKKKKQWIANNEFGVVLYLWIGEKSNCYEFLKREFKQWCSTIQSILTQTIENKTKKTRTYGVVVGQIYTANKIVEDYITTLVNVYWKQ